MELRSKHVSTQSTTTETARMKHVRRDTPSRHSTRIAIIIWPGRVLCCAALCTDGRDVPACSPPNPTLLAPYAAMPRTGQHPRLNRRTTCAHGTAAKALSRTQHPSPRYVRGSRGETATHLATVTVVPSSLRGHDAPPPPRGHPYIHIAPCASRADVHTA